MSTEPNPDDAVLSALAPWRDATRLWIAYSGGVDSHVLLHAAVRLGARVAAVHVDHALQPESRDWAQHCLEVCAALGVACTVRRVVVEHNGEGVEASARRARYRVFREFIGAGEYLGLAHHADDQAETVLLRLLRGTGVDGLAAMPAQRPLGGGRLIRPLLGLRRSLLRDYAHGHRLEWIEDPSNADRTLDRNFLRHDIMPLLETRWSGLPKRLARCARHAADHRAAMDWLLAQRLALDESSIEVAALRTLPPEARLLAMRYWLRRQGLRAPPEARLRQGLEDLLTAGEGRQPELLWGDAQVRRYRGRLHCLPQRLSDPPGRWRRWDPRRPLAIPNVGRLEWRGDDAVKPMANIDELYVTFRHGGERFQPIGSVHSHPLKHWLQTWNIPPWQRGRLPLVYAADTLIAVGGIAGARHPAVAPGRFIWTPVGNNFNKSN